MCWGSPGTLVDRHLLSSALRSISNTVHLHKLLSYHWQYRHYLKCSFSGLFQFFVYVTLIFFLKIKILWTSIKQQKSRKNVCISSQNNLLQKDVSVQKKNLDKYIYLLLKKNLRTKWELDRNNASFLFLFFFVFSFHSCKIFFLNGFLSNGNILFASLSAHTQL